MTTLVLPLARHSARRTEIERGECVFHTRVFCRGGWDAICGSGRQLVRGRHFRGLEIGSLRLRTPRAPRSHAASHETEPRSGVLRCVSHAHSNARRPAARAWRDRTVVSRSEPTVGKYPTGFVDIGGPDFVRRARNRSGSDRAPRLGPRHLFWRPSRLLSRVSRSAPGNLQLASSASGFPAITLQTKNPLTPTLGLFPSMRAGRRDGHDVQGSRQDVRAHVRGLGERYQGWVGAELSKYGLRYDDLLDETMNLDVAEALKRLPQEERDLRMQRLKRAMDLSMKHVYLDKEMQKKQTPFQWYVRPVLEEVEAERDERAAPGHGAAVQPPDSVIGLARRRRRPSEAHLSGPTNRAPRAVVIIALHSSIHARVRVRIVRVDHASRSVEPIAQPRLSYGSRDASLATSPRSRLLGEFYGPGGLLFVVLRLRGVLFRVSRLVRARRFAAMRSMMAAVVSPAPGPVAGEVPRTPQSPSPRRPGRRRLPPLPTPPRLPRRALARTRTPSPPPTFHGSSATTTATRNAARRSRVTRPGAHDDHLVRVSTRHHPERALLRVEHGVPYTTPRAHRRVLVHAHDEKIAERAGARSRNFRT